MMHVSVFKLSFPVRLQSTDAASHLFYTHIFFCPGKYTGEVICFVVFLFCLIGKRLFHFNLPKEIQEVILLQNFTKKQL